MTSLVRAEKQDPKERRARMDLQDSMPKAWRLLVYEHGQTKVLALFEQGFSLRDAKDFLS